MFRSIRSQLTAFTAVAVGAALLSATPALAGSTRSDNRDDRNSNAAAASTTTRAARGDQQICVRERRTGSRLVSTVCKTEREWAAEGEVPGRE